LFKQNGNIYSVVIFVSEEASLKKGIGPVPETRRVKFRYLWW